MSKYFCALVLSVMASAAVLAGTGGIAALLQQQRLHGFVAPEVALGQLVGLSAEAGPAAPLELRMRYHATLALLNLSGEHTPQVQAELLQLETMAVTERCADCRQYKMLREVQWAVRRQDLAALRPAMQALDTLPPSANADLLQELQYVRGVAHDTLGEYARAVEYGIRAQQLAAAANSPADQVRALNLLALANFGRRDLPRAQAYAIEAYALAEQIGFTYMMAYVRGNQAVIHSFKGETGQQYQALMDSLAITRSQPGLGDMELINLVNLAHYHLTQKDPLRATQLAAQGIRLAGQQNKPVAKGAAMMSLGDAQVLLGEHEKGLATMVQAIALLTKSDAKVYLPDALERLANAYNRTGHHREAFETLGRQVKIKDAMNALAREKAVAEAQQKFSVERKDRDIERLSLETARGRAEVSAGRWQRRLWAAAALILALGAALLIDMVKRARASNRVLVNNNALLSDESAHDPLTGAFNRRHCHVIMDLQAALLAAKSRDRNYQACVGLMLLDVDHFKQINDHFGHAAGDAVLVEIARRLQTLVRQKDVVVRWGGEEFVLVLPGTAPEGMAVLAERVLRLIGDEVVVSDGKPMAVSVSIGCIVYPLFPGQHWEDTLKVADAAMYMAKDGGRNRALCLMSMADDADLELVRADLVQAARAGQVTLRTIEGPPPNVRQPHARAGHSADTQA